MKTIEERKYMSTGDFVGTNKLEKEAVELFGKDWEPEDDISQIEQLLKHIGAKVYEVRSIDEGRRSDYDMEVVFNSDLKEIADLKEQSRLLIERLKANHKAIDEATDIIAKHCLSFGESDEYEELLSQLAPNEELLKKLED